MEMLLPAGSQELIQCGHFKSIINISQDTYFPPVLCGLQLLLNVLQGQVPLLGRGRDAVVSISRGREWLEDDLEGLA